MIFQVLNYKILSAMHQVRRKTRRFSVGQVRQVTCKNEVCNFVGHFVNCNLRFSNYSAFHKSGKQSFSQAKIIPIAKINSVGITW